MKWYSRKRKEVASSTEEQEEIKTRLSSIEGEIKALESRRKQMEAELKGGILLLISVLVLI